MKTKESKVKISYDVKTSGLDKVQKKLFLIQKQIKELSRIGVKININVKHDTKKWYQFWK